MLGESEDFGTAVSEKRASMSDLIYRLEMEAKEE